jgi:transketolase
MRTSFIQELIVLARSNPRIFLVVGDLGYAVVDPFAREFPARFLNAGVAEQNMTGLAAGLASEGYHVFTYSIANFSTFRCAEQIRNDVAYHKLPVTVVAVGGGLAYGNLGYSHHAVQDMALLRTFPGMAIAAPGDPHETRAVLRQLCAKPQPSYLRLGKAGEPLVHGGIVDVRPGQLLRHAAAGTTGRRLLLTTGATLKLAHDVWLTRPAGEWQLASLPLWGEQWSAQIAAQLLDFDYIVTVEDHLRAGGFGSFLQEALSETEFKGRLRAVALSPEVCGLVASQLVLNARGGVSFESLLKVVQSFS